MSLSGNIGLQAGNIKPDFDTWQPAHGDEAEPAPNAPGNSSHTSATRPLFSLIVATYARKEPLEGLFKSLLEQDIGLASFEVIVVDQNQGLIDELVLDYSRLRIIHIKSIQLGLSLTRNLGIAQAHGRFLCFPDDDCRYYPDTLSSALAAFESSGSRVVTGRIRDRDRAKNVLRHWPGEDRRIGLFNFYRFVSSITLFVKNETPLYFNENLGVGCFYGSAEDADYLYRSLKIYGSGAYFSNLHVWHPDTALIDLKPAKITSYGLGFGAFCAMHRSDIPILLTFFMSMSLTLARCLLFAVCGKCRAARLCFTALKARAKGFWTYSVGKENPRPEGR